MFVFHYCIYTEVPKESNIQQYKGRYTGNHPGHMQVERSGDTGRSLDDGAYPHVGGDSAEVQCVIIYGVSEGQERHDDI